jgi:phage gp45-like
VNAFRVVLDSIVDGAYRIFKGEGRPQEQCTGALFQHYGLRTQPPANVDLFTLQYGNNHFSVAENDGALLGKDLAVGDVYLYTGPDNFIKLTASAVAITSASTKIAETVANAQPVMTEAYKSAIETFLGPTGPLQAAITFSISALGGAYTAVTFIPPVDGLTSKVELE